MAGAVCHAHNLHWLSFATIHKSMRDPILGACQRVTAVPELSGLCLIGDFLQGLDQFSILDQPEKVTAKLEVVAHLVNGKTSHALDIDTPFHISDQVFRREIVFPGLQVEIWYPVDGKMVEAVGATASVGFFPSYDWCCFAGCAEI